MKLQNEWGTLLVARFKEIIRFVTLELLAARKMRQSLRTFCKLETFTQNLRKTYARENP
jgi:glutaredoxin-related protein